MHYQSSMQFAMSVTPATKQIIIWTSTVFLLQHLFPYVTGFLLLFYSQSPWFGFWQPLTYMFVHQGLWHLLFNMFSLWMFGSIFERSFGVRELLKVYFMCGIGTGMLWSVIPNNLPILGASAGVYGLLVAFAYFWPQARILLFGVVPMRAKTLVLCLIAVGLFLSVRPSQDDTVAHLAHLIGSAIAFVYLQLKYKRYRFLNFTLSVPIKNAWRKFVQLFRKLK